MRKILWINPVYKMRTHDGDRVDLWAQHFQEILDKAKREDTTVDITDLGVNKEFNTPYFPGMLASSDILKTVVRAEQKGYDAAIIGCASDPCAKEAKRLVNIPVIAPSEAGVMMARLSGKRWSFIIPGVFDKKKLVAAYRWIEYMGIDVDNLSCRGAQLDGLRGSSELMELIETESPEKVRDFVLERFRKALVDIVPKLAKSCIEEDGAEMILLGCTFWSGWNELEMLSKKLGVPVVDPSVNALMVAENLADILKIKR